MAEPLIIVNLKAYAEGMGEGAGIIAAAAEEIGEESGVTIGVAPAYTDLHPIAMHYAVPVYAQHIDGVAPGAYTGHVTAEQVRAAGAFGTLINHSERRLTLAAIEASCAAARKSDLQTVICTNNAATTAAAAALSPDYVAIEPPELIGSGISVSKADPGIIERSVLAVKNVNPGVRVLTGAGISTGECVRIALELGTDGVLLASGVVKAKDPAVVLRDLVSLI
jgi:triosephosphate isomerase